MITPFEFMSLEQKLDSLNERITKLEEKKSVKDVKSDKSVKAKPVKAVKKGSK